MIAAFRSRSRCNCWTTEWMRSNGACYPPASRTIASGRMPFPLQRVRVREKRIGRRLSNELGAVAHGTKAIL